MGNLKTPDWILEGYNSKEEYEKAKGINKEKKKTKTFKIKKCPECGADDIKVVVGDENETGNWQCNKCSWKGKKPKIEELTEEEFMKYLDEKGEKVA